MTGNLHQSWVSPEADQNRRLPMDTRIENLEHDMTSLTEVMQQLVQQNGRYTEYLDQQISIDAEERETWLLIKRRLLTGGSWAAVVALFMGLGLLIKEWISK